MYFGSVLYAQNQLVISASLSGTELDVIEQEDSVAVNNGVEKTLNLNIKKLE